MIQPSHQEAERERYSMESTVLSYAVPPSMGQMLREVCGKLRVKLWEADDPIDLLAVPNFLMVCNFSRLSPTAVKQTYSYLVEMAGHGTTLLFTTPPPVKPPSQFTKHVVKAPENLGETFLRLLILRRMNSVRSHIRTARSYDKKLHRLFFILRAIRAQGFVRSRDFCSELGVSQRTIARDIALLATMGELVEYDARRKGYSIQGEFIGAH